MLDYTSSTLGYDSLKRTLDGKKLFISKDDMSVLTDNPEEALPFFSKNHIQVWKKCNPTFTDVTMVEMLKDDGTIKEITTVKEKIILAFQDNRKDLIEVSKHDDYEEVKYCEGYECAMLYVLGLLGISEEEALRS